MIQNVIFDFDGVFTDGTFYYSNEGKVLKKFGSHDARAIKICKKHYNLCAITADSRGFDISNSRASDMGLSLILVPEPNRAQWIKDNYEKNSTALAVDSFTDIPSLINVSRSFAPSDAHPDLLKRVTDRLTCGGGRGAVAEILEKLLFEKFGKHLWEYL